MNDEHDYEYEDDEFILGEQTEEEWVEEMISDSESMRG